MCPGAAYQDNDGYSLIFIEHKENVIFSPREASQAPEGLGTSEGRAEELPLRVTTPPGSLPEPNAVVVSPFYESCLRCSMFCPGSALVPMARLTEVIAQHQADCLLSSHPTPVLLSRAETWGGQGQVASPAGPK